MKLYAEDLLAPYFEVYIDEKNEDRCIWADEEKGEICVYGKNTPIILKGKVKLIPKSNLKHFLSTIENNE